MLTCLFANFLYSSKILFAKFVFEASGVRNIFCVELSGRLIYLPSEVIKTFYSLQILLQIV